MSAPSNHTTAWSRSPGTPDAILTVASSLPSGVDTVAEALRLLRCLHLRPDVVHTDGGATYARFQLRTHTPVSKLRHRLTAALATSPGHRDGPLRWDLLAPPVRILVLVSREAHCLTALLNAHAHDELRGGTLVGVAGNYRDLEPETRRAGLPFDDLPHSETPEQTTSRLLALVQDRQADLVVAARYMRIIPEAACRALAGRIMNIHHALSPAFKGARAHHQAAARGVKVVGGTAHYITPELDEGPIIEQVAARVTVPVPTAADFAAAGAAAEAQALLSAVRLHCSGRIVLDDAGHTVIIPDDADSVAESRTA